MEVFRLILETEPGRVDTGATYPDCTLADRNSCLPAQFLGPNAFQDAVNWANAHNEIPVRVVNADHAWSIINGSQPITDDMVITELPVPGLLSGFDPMMIVLAIGATFVLPRLLKGKLT